MNGILLSVDIKAAFDTALPSTINKCLDLLFPNHPLIKCLAKFSHSATANVSINGRRGTDIQLTRGVGQGDPSSSTKFTLIHFLFNIFLEKFFEKHKLAIIMSELDDSLPNTPLPNIAFADDTAAFLNSLITDNIAEDLLLLYKNLEISTGLEIHPDKSSFITIGDISQNSLNSLSKIAKQEISLNHLGVILREDITLASKETYNNILMRMERKKNDISKMCGKIDIFTKKLIVNTTLRSIPNHVMRVYPPTSEQINHIWKKQKQSLWSFTTKQGQSIIRTKIAAERISALARYGGLEIQHTITTASLSMLSSFFSIMIYSMKYPDTLLAAFFKKNDYDFYQNLRFLNPYYFENEFSQKLLEYFPQSQHLIDHINQIMIYVEIDPYTALHMPLYKHSLWKKFPHPQTFLCIKKKDFLDGGILDNFKTVASLMNCKYMNRKLYLDPENYNSKLDKLPPQYSSQLKWFLTEVKKNIDFHYTGSSYKKRNLTLFENVANKTTETLFNLLKRVAKHNLHPSKIPPAWTNRMTEQRITPPLEIFQNSLQLTFSISAPPSLKSFTYEYLLRTAISPNKLHKMYPKEYPNPSCTRPECNQAISNSDHISFECIFAESIFETIREAIKRRNLHFRLDEFDFLFPNTTHKNFKELFILTSYARLQFFQATNDEKFHKWSYHHFYVKYLSILNKSIEACSLYEIPHNNIDILLQDAQENALGFLCYKMHL